MKNIKETTTEVGSKIKGGLKMKNWSLKKKLLVGAGVLVTGALGVLAYGKSKQENTVEYNGNDENEDYEDEDYEDEDQDGVEPETVQEAE